MVALQWYARQAEPQCAARMRNRAGMRQAATTCLAEVAIPKAGFAGVKSEAEFMAVLEAGVAAQLIPKQLLPGFVDFYQNYKGASRRAACLGLCSKRAKRLAAFCARWLHSLVRHQSGAEPSHAPGSGLLT